MKSEKIQLYDEYRRFFDALKDKTPLVDERIIKKIGKSVGFKTSDEKVYKILSLVSEKFLDDVLTSINHKSKKDIDYIDRKYREAESDDSRLIRNAEQEVPKPAQELDVDSGPRARKLAHRSPRAELLPGQNIEVARKRLARINRIIKALMRCICVIKMEGAEDLYYFEDCYRKVRDREYEYKTWAKKRWFGRPLLEVLLTEFLIFTEEYYVD